LDEVSIEDRRSADRDTISSDISRMLILLSSPRFDMKLPSPGVPESETVLRMGERKRLVSPRLTNHQVANVEMGTQDQCRHWLRSSRGNDHGI
jgi:hypothetical protein